MSISKRNRRGVWVILITCIALSYIPRVLASLSDNSLTISYEELDEAEKVVATKKRQEASKKKFQKKPKGKKVYRTPDKAFDPNDYRREDWMKLGLSEKQVDVIMKFSSRGIRSNEDLKKIYVLPEELYDLIKDSTRYPKIDFEIDPITEEKKEFDVVNINAASYDELIELPGIGDYYAKKIITYREELGGYVGPHQLLDIWKFGTERYDQLSSRICTNGKINKININRADIDELKAHPYISYKVANSIVKMRQAHGEYESLRDILRSDLIDEELFDKVQSYLSL